jgi:hypothetical protein
MAGNLSPAAQGKIAELQLMEMKVQRAHGMVELFATAKTNPDQYVLPMTRQFTRLKQELMGMGLDSMSQLAGSMEIASKRGLSHGQKARILREGVGSLKFQLELAQRAVVSDDQAAQKEKAAAAERKAAGGP